MYSNLVKAYYEIKDMNLKELREIIVKQNNLTPLDILKGFHEKSKIRLEYSSCITEENMKDIKLIQEEYKSYLLNHGRELVQKVYDEKFNALLAEYQKEEPTATIETMTHYLNDKHPNMSVSLKNASFKFSREIKDVCNKLKSDVEKSAKEYITSWMKEKFGDKYKITKNDFYRFEGLPSSLNVNQNINIDFSNVYEVNETKFDDGCGFSQISIIYFDTHIKDDSISDKIKFYDYDMIKVSVYINESKARELFDNAVNSVINQNNSVGELEYLQNLESQPITININEDNKFELIDGYKRLLYITDENLLKYNAPIKIFTDLNDLQFLSLLYASNVWKTENKFHDRGFLFALKTRFDFEIPMSAYEKIFENELDILQLYDFGGNSVRVNKERIMNTLDTHEHLVDDISIMYNFLTEESEKNHGYDENISDEIKFTIIELVGELRRTKYKYNHQNELSEEFIVSIYNDDFINKLCAKKHLSTRTYVINYFRDKGIYNRIKDMIKNNLVIEESKMTN